ncbi:LiaF transmembrane domain-containing protein [Chitinophaga vietnamensis]|uniref:LiaF transmembrane domain-containing protein n=1 Tax=Chitinophaga vietnamensis TaxID=2593957 RepID=UPI00117858F3|nr:hypothetical protein [Chitinophaga vietnamensis]
MSDNDVTVNKRRGRGLGGAILVLIGLGLLLRQLPLDIPDWMFSWQMILIVVGLFVGYKHNFKGGGWLSMVLVGGVFLVGDIFDWPYNSAQFIWPVVLIIIGIVILLKRDTYSWSDRYKKWDKHQKWDKYREQYSQQFNQSQSWPMPDTQPASDANEDTINYSAVFGSISKQVMSKDFKGGSVSAIFGGIDLNFTHSDIQGIAILDVTTMFGGCELVVPASWTIKMEITTIMGGVEDKRPSQLMGATNKDKTLVVRGSCVCGGVEIKSYS